MPQLATQADGLIDTITTQKEALASLTQTVARGVPALRDAAENVLELNPATSTPLLTSNANDIGLSYDSGVLAVVDQTGQIDRPLTADNVTVGGGATVINAGGFSGPSISGSDYLHLSGTGNASVHAHEGKVVATDRYEAPGATFGGVNIGYGYGVDTEGFPINVGNSKMDVNGLFGNQVNGFGASFGGIDINNGGIATYGRSITAANFYADGAVTGTSASFGGVDINGGGIATYGRTITCGTIFPASCRVGGSVVDGNGVAGFQGTFGGVALGSNGISAPGTIACGWLHSLGDINADRSIGAGYNMVAQGFVVVSDQRRKRDIHDLPPSSDLFAKLRPRTFAFRNDTPDTPDQIGFVAQELPPELQRTADDGTLRYDLSHVLAVTVAEVKHQAGVITDLVAQIAALTARLDALEGATA